MKDYNWKIKISDLLTNPGDTDTVKFQNKFIKTEDIKLGNNGISGTIFLQGLNHDEILLKIEYIEFKNIFQCDKCLKRYEKTIELKNIEEIRFINPSKTEFNETIYDTVFPIDMKNQNIEISTFIEIIVKNEEPIIKKCEKCKNKQITEEEKNQDEISSYKINFSRLLKS